MAGTDEVTIAAGVLDWGFFEHDPGYVAGVDGVLRTADVHTPTEPTTRARVPYYTIPFSAWYYLAPDLALRKERKGDFDGRPTPDLSGAKPIVCDR